MNAKRKATVFILQKLKTVAFLSVYINKYINMYLHLYIVICVKSFMSMRQYSLYM